MQLIKYVRVLRRRWWMIVLCPIVASLAAGVVSSELPRVYEAHVHLYVRPAQPLAPADPNVAALSTDQIMNTYATLMKEPPLLERVRARMGLTRSIADLANQITVRPVPTTTILDVAVTDANPATAMILANTLVDEFKMELQGMQQSLTARSFDNLVVVAPATLPDIPISPSRTRIVAFAAAAGLLVGLLLAFLLEYLDQSVKTNEDLTERFGLITLGHIAFVPAKRGHTELVTLDGQPASEAYKSLRTSLQFSTIDQDVTSIVVTSPGPQEGKSRTASNLAVVLGQAGFKTLLVDADLRHPSLHKLFSKGRNIGLSNLIVQSAEEHEAITAVDMMPNLWLLTSGTTPPNPSELLGSGRMRELMAEFKKFFRYIVLDTPPVNAVTDASILAASANATILVVAQGRTTFPAVGHAQQLLDRVGAHTVGAVMNQVRASSGSPEYEFGPYGDGKSSDQAKQDEGSPSKAAARKRARRT